MARFATNRHPVIFGPLVATLLFLISTFAFADADQKSLDAICDRTIAETENCCVRGDCVIPDMTGVGTQYALVAGPEEMRDVRRACGVWTENPIQSCPDGRYILQKSIRHNEKSGIIASLKAKLALGCEPGTNTQLTTLSSEAESTAPLSINDSLRKIISDQRKRCELRFKEYIDEQSASALFGACSPDRKKKLIAVRAEAHGLFEKLVESSNTHVETDSAPGSDYLKNLKAKTCPQVIDWNGYFRSKVPLYPDAFKAVIDDLLKEKWQTARSEKNSEIYRKDVDRLLTRECFLVERETQTMVPGVPCTGLWYYRADFYTSEYMKNRNKAPNQSPTSR